MKKKIFLAITIINGKAEACQISEKYYNDFNWRLKRKEDAEKGEFQIYFTETEITK
jgi:hypothetical protein